MISPVVSCDTFVVLPPLTDRSVVIFGKNSDRPQNEVQEVVYFPRAKHEKDTKLKCTYIEIDQSEQTFAVALSKPSWMWGAEMGSNEHNLVIGNEAIFSQETDRLDSKQMVSPNLLGMDLVRLGLERSKNAAEGVQVIVALLEQYGQGGLCVESNESKDYADLSYHNSFLIADPTEAWVLETVGKQWAAEQIVQGFRNISNCLTIGKNFQKSSSGLKQYALDQGWWNGKEEEFDFAQVFASKSKSKTNDRFEAGKKLLHEKTKDKKFDIFRMMEILRDCESGICRSKDSAFPTQASQISVLDKRLSSHWFTATPDPKHSVFKPVVFTDNVKLGKNCSVPIQPPCWKHQLYARHERCYASLLDGSAQDLSQTLTQLERDCVLELQAKLDQEDQLDDAILQLGELFEDAVEAELRFYKQ